MILPGALISGEPGNVPSVLGFRSDHLGLRYIHRNPVKRGLGERADIIGASKIQQLHDNLAALDFTIPPELLKRLNDVSASETHYPYYFFAGEFRMVSSGTTVLRSAAKRAA